MPPAPNRSAAADDKLSELYRESNQLAAKLKAVQGEITAIEEKKAARRRERAMVAAVASSSVYRDGTPRNSPEHREIARRYAWYAYKSKSLSPRIRPDQTGSAKLITLIRMREIERLYSVRYGAELPDDDAGRDDLLIAAHHIAHLGPDASRHIVAWAALWAPWMASSEAEALAASVVRNPVKFTADRLAWRLRLTAAERHELGITTIGAVGQTQEIRKALRKMKRREADRKRRRANGAVHWEESISRKKPWEADGVSRATWYRHRTTSPRTTKREGCEGSSARVGGGRIGRDGSVWEVREAADVVPNAPETKARPAGKRESIAGRELVSKPSGARQSLARGFDFARDLRAAVGQAFDGCGQFHSPPELGLKSKLKRTAAHQRRDDGNSRPAIGAKAELNPVRGDIYGRRAETA
ncbi:MAG TPA: hypothetical protein VH684_11600 [Xanthobacteraceae bacterium]|jgi:hypothetical protein